MSAPRVVLLPGNGWADVRAEPVRAELERAGVPFELVVQEYPAGEDFDTLLEALARSIRAADPALVHGTGIGALVALALRARGELADVPLVLQGAVLWGLETRRFPRLMRVPGMTRLLVAMFRQPAFRRRFARKQFEREHSSEFLTRFFDGYRDAAEFARWFRWLTPEFLRGLERQFSAHPERLATIEFWWGERDHVVGLDELERTERALGTSFPCRRFADWGHYPMIDAPEAWVSEVADALATAGDAR